MQKKAKFFYFFAFCRNTLFPLEREHPHFFRKKQIHKDEIDDNKGSRNTLHCITPETATIALIRSEGAPGKKQPPEARRLAISRCSAAVRKRRTYRTCIWRCRRGKVCCRPHKARNIPGHLRRDFSLPERADRHRYRRHCRQRLPL